MSEGQIITTFESTFTTMAQPDEYAPTITMPEITGTIGGDDTDTYGGVAFPISAYDEHGVSAVECQVVEGNAPPGDAWRAAIWSGPICASPSHARFGTAVRRHPPTVPTPSVSRVDGHESTALSDLWRTA